MKDRPKPRRRDSEVGRHEHFHLRVAVLLDDERLIVIADEFGDLRRKGESADAQRVDMQTFFRQQRLRFVHRGRGRSVVEDPDPRRPCRRFQNRTRQQAARGFEFAQQALHVVDIGRGVFGIAGEPVAAGAAGEIGAEGRMDAGKGAVGNAVAIDIVVAAERPRPARVPRR